MPEHRPGRVERVVASAAVRHGAPAADDGFVGSAVKTDTPPADAARASLDLIAAGSGYNLVVDGKISVPWAPINTAARGDLIYINSTDNTISTASGAGKQVLGKLSELPGERGGPLDRARVNLNKKTA